MTITLCRWISFTTRDGCRAGRDHHVDTIAMGSNRLVSGVTIIRTIGRHPANRTVNLIEQRADLGRIVDVLIGQRLRYDCAYGPAVYRVQASGQLLEIHDVQHRLTINLT